MAACKKYQTLIAGHWFGDLTVDEEDRLHTHLQSCLACAEALEGGAETLASLGKPVVPDLPQHFWQGYWTRLAQKMEAGEASRPVSFREKVTALLHAPWSPAIRLAGAAAIFVAGVLVSRMFWITGKPVAEVTPMAAPPARAIVADPRADDLLSRSKVLLIGFANLDPEAVSSGEFDFSKKRQISQQLITEAVALQNDPTTSKDRQLLQLVNQLEMVLLQIANLEAEHDVEAVELVRSSIDREGLLLKINIEEMKRIAAPSAGTSVL